MSKKVIWKNLEEEEKRRFNELWGEKSTLKDSIISVPYKVLMPRYYQSIAERVLNFEVRPDDIWIITYPKCGTTWTQEIVWHIMNDVNKELGKLPLFARSPFLEFQGIHGHENSPASNFPKMDEKQAEMIRRIFDESIDMTDNLPSPRIIKSHMPFELLPEKLLDTAKVIYVCRNPKDTCVSFFYHITDALQATYEYKGDFDQFIDCFMDGKIEYGSYFDHLKSGWKHRNHPNMKFVWYEDMRKNSLKEVSDIASFINHPISEAKIEELVEHLKFSNMKDRATKQSADAKSKGLGKFFRKGEVGDWKNHFKGDKLKKWDDWIAKNLEGSDIEFKFE